jgi:hypothetical protein
MKKLGKLNINFEKLIKDEDLQKLRGGWLGDCAIYENGSYLEMRDWLCYVEYAWQCDHECAQHFSYLGSNISCFCNWPY